MKDQKEEIPKRFRIPDGLWEKIQRLLPPQQAKPQGGRPRNNDRRMMEAIVYVLKTGVQWKALPRSIAAGSSAHDRFQEWNTAGVFQKLWRAGLLEYEKIVGIDWKWQAMDAAIIKAPLRGCANRFKPHR
ncbi:transposase [Candidatus Jettenia caeni]|uniref:Transposase n=1 Tax=Candidatus Jettenia caeni TaxID=247490 RepID=I3IGV1_9BACT|nr:transposase [Candidatus Jettenia caeni]GJQ47247.1 MAG: hypothetical protein JETCAE04_30010 [Candidatus Jettenia caeni]